MPKKAHDLGALSGARNADERMREVSRTMERWPIEFDSEDGRTRIRGFVWWDENPFRARRPLRPRGMVQLVHGMAEHIERYDEFARSLVGAGYLVCGHDQLGHGRSCAPERHGCLPTHGGKDILVGDVERLRQLVVGLCAPATPLFVFGHSMGSFVVRVYLSLYGDRVGGGIICGTGTVPAATSRVGGALARLVARVCGADHRSSLLHSLAEGAYGRAIEGARTDYDWLSHNRENVQRYLADDACGFAFGAGGYATLADLTAEACSLECAQRVPHALPLLYISGSEDVVGACGKGVQAAAGLARQAGSTDVVCTIYAGMRHEILNEDDRGIVYGDIRNWLDAHTNPEGI